MTDKQLLEQIVSRTESLNRTLQSTNPFTIPDTESRRVYQEVSDDVRNLNADVRVALRNYDKLHEFYLAHQPQEEFKLHAVG